MYNHQSDIFLFRALQGYHTEELTEEAIIKRQHAAKSPKPKVQERLLESLGGGLVSLGLKLKAQDQPEAVTPMPESC